MPQSKITNSRKVIWPGSTQLAPVPAVLVACGNSGGHKANLITIAWAGIVCSKPPMLSISVRPERFSYPILRECGEFSVNLPTAQMAATVDWCGVVSGRDHDKFAESGLTAVPGKQISAPIVAECPLSMECKVTQILELGAHHLFLAEILAVQVSEELLDASGRLNLERDNLLAYVHGHYYNLGECIGHFGFSVRKKPGPVKRTPRKR
ncbi:MAG: flavin reductase family protein [Lentisphaeria bacterium]|nr:flavin reductase family protein [Lentisphaeria bacterium]